MKNSIQDCCDKAEKFVRQFYSNYLEKRDFKATFAALDKNISWFGTGKQEVCLDLSDAVTLLGQEADSWDGKFKILKQWYKTVPMSENFCIVYGEIEMVEDGLNTILTELDSRFTIICHVLGDKVTMLHSHLSVGNPLQGKNEYIHKGVQFSYDAKLEEKLIERTKLLKEKTVMLETLINNIVGGVASTTLDEGFSFSYISETFLKLLGYSKEELSDNFGNKLLRLIPPEEMERVVETIHMGIDLSGRYSLEYRLKRKNGSLIWVRDQGSIIISQDGDSIEHVFVDVTENKAAEEQLKISEKRYEMVSKLSDIVIFDYDIESDLLINNPIDVATFGIPMTIENPSKTMVETGTIKQKTADSFRQMYESIRDGAPFSQCTVDVLDANGNDAIYQISLTSVFDDNGKPVRAIGVSKDITSNFELVFKAEHDLLTGLFNKVITEQQVDLFLATKHAKMKSHAFFMIDIDCFKSINDNFGHIFGDAILSQVAAKIKNCFSDIDILGRIGGDEFVAFLKNISSRQRAIDTAKKLCEDIRETYAQNGVNYQLSVSIGIAFYSDDGTSYNELYRSADTAMYYSKENGKNNYTIYDSKMGEAKSQTAQIEFESASDAKNFESNITEYVFKILHEAAVKEIAITSILELIGKHYRLGRTYIMENKGDTYCNTFEWCAKGVSPQIEQLAAVPRNEFADWRNSFNKKEHYLYSEIEDMPPSTTAFFEKRQMKSMLNFSILKEGKVIGVIGFDQSGYHRKPTTREFSEIRNISNVLGVFIVEMRAFEEEQKLKNAVMSIVNGLDSCAYVCNPYTYEILFINSTALDKMKVDPIKKLCYEIFTNRTSPCDDCPMKKLLENPELKRFTLNVHSEVLDRYFRSTASWVDWVDGSKACLIDSVDVTEFFEKG